MSDQQRLQFPLDLNPQQLLANMANIGFVAFAMDPRAGHTKPGDPCHNAVTNGSLGPNIACIGHLKPRTEEEKIAVKIGRARLAGPTQVTKDATVAELDATTMSIKVLAKGTNEWVCFPGNEDEIGNVPMACDPMGLQWIQDLLLGKPAPTNKAPGLIYMLCGATQRSISNPFDQASPSIPIGPHYMIIWPFDAKQCGFPTDVRDAGAWVMYDKTPWSHLHICGSPWDGNVYHPEKAPNPIWTLKYAASSEDSQQTGWS